MINSVVLMGRLTYEPELRTTSNGLSVISFQIACDRQYQAKGDERKADFIDVT
ncbi:MAG: single-stranded DNA-binding protein, partial [Eubacterium sp.]